MIDDVQKRKHGVSRFIKLRIETKMISRNGMSDFGGNQTRNARVECVMYRVSIDKESVAEGNKFGGGPVFKKMG
jgi:hypothetical protein